LEFIKRSAFHLENNIGYNYFHHTFEFIEIFKVNTPMLSVGSKLISARLEISWKYFVNFRPDQPTTFR